MRGPLFDEEAIDRALQEPTMVRALNFALFGGLTVGILLGVAITLLVHG